jgi:hypothetical protein
MHEKIEYIKEEKFFSHFFPLIHIILKFLQIEIIGLYYRLINCIALKKELNNIK